MKIIKIIFMPPFVDLLISKEDYNACAPKYAKRDSFDQRNKYCLINDRSVYLTFKHLKQN